MRLRRHHHPGPRRAPSEPRSRVTVGVAILALISTACAGPREPLEVGVADIRSDIVLGAVGTVVAEAPPAPVPPNSMPVRRIVIVQPPAAPLPPPPDFPKPLPPPDLGPCPPASPLSAPKLIAGNDIPLPPAPGMYEYRNDGEFETSGANAQKGEFPAESRREVTDVVANGDGTFSFAVRATLAQTVTITTYVLEPVAVDGEGGLFIDKVVSKEYAEGDDPQDPDADAQLETTFDPVEDLKLVTLPMVTGEGVDSVGIDPETQQAMAISTTVEVKDRINACGEFVDSQVLSVDGDFGQCVEAPSALPVEPPVPLVLPCVEQGGANLNLQDGSRSTFHATYHIATQYGGLFVQDAIEILTEGSSGNVYRENAATINSVPRLPADPPAAPEGDQA